MNFIIRALKQSNSSVTFVEYASYFSTNMPRSNSNKDKVAKRPQLIGPISSLNGTVKINVIAKPGAKYNAVTGIEEDGVPVSIAAPPVDGEANCELVRFIAKQLGVRKSDVMLEQGHRSRHKILSVAGLTTEQVESRLNTLISNHRVCNS